MERESIITKKSLIYHTRNWNQEPIHRWKRNDYKDHQSQLWKKRRGNQKDYAINQLLEEKHNPFLFTYVWIKLEHIWSEQMRTAQWRREYQKYDKKVNLGSNKKS